MQGLGKKCEPKQRDRPEGCRGQQSDGERECPYDAIETDLLKARQVYRGEGNEDVD